MNRLLLIFLLCAFNNKLNAQSNLGKEWFIGSGTYVVNFESSSPTVKYLNPLDSLSNIFKANSNICDSNGHLLIATDGIKLYNAKGQYIAGGGQNINNDSIVWGDGNDTAYPNTSIVLPKGNNQYYVFIATMSDAKYMQYYNNGGYYDFDELRYSVVDMNANIGKGLITIRNKLLLHVDTDPWLNKSNMTACRHANGRDWWLLKPSARLRQKMHKFLVSPDTIINYTQDLPINFTTMCFDNVGQSAFNMDGTLYAECNNYSPHTIYNFDRCSGELTLKRVFDAKPFKDTFGTSNWGGNENKWRGLCFSPNSRFLYTCDAYNVYQIDLDNPIDSLAIRRVSKDTTYYPTVFGFPEYSNMQLTPTGVIYLGNWHGISEHINGIMQPDKLGDSCEFKFSYFICNLNDSGTQISNTNGPPNMPFYGLGKLVGSPCDTIKVPTVTQLNPIVIPNVFSPNGDGLNDTWHILNVAKLQADGIQLQEVGIYNRLGNCVFKSNDINFAWDAKGWASGTYFYYLRYKKANGVSEVMKGDLNVVR